MYLVNLKYWRIKMIDIDELIKEFQNEGVPCNRIHNLVNALLEERKQYIPTKKWEPKSGNYKLSANGRLIPGGSIISIDRINFGMEFETEESAEKAAAYYRKIHRLYKLAEELNEGWEPDWSDHNQYKYSVYFDGSSCGWRYRTYSYSNHLLPAFKDEATARRAIELIEAGALE